MTASVGGSEPVTGTPRLTKSSSNPCRAGGDEHACALRADDVGVRDVARGEAVVACVEVDPLVADEDGDLTLEYVERLVLVVVKVQGRPRRSRSAKTRGRSRHRLL